MKKHKKTKILLSILAVIVIVRLIMPYVIENLANRMIAKNPDITGGIGDVDLWILSGRAEFEGLSISKAGGEIPAPIISANRVAFSISWKDLFRGKLFGDIDVIQPVLNIVDGKRKEDTQTGAEIDWRKALTSFYPFEINRISIKDGEVHLRNFKSEPPVDVYLNAIELEVLNITNELNIEDSQAAQVNLSATTIGDGKVSLSSTFNLIQQPAKASLTASISDLDLTALNDFARAYANLDVQAGKFDLDAELNFTENNKIADINGQITPVARKINVLRWQADAERQQDPGIIIAWEGLVDGVKWLLEAGPRDRIETTVPIEGSIENPEVGAGSAVWGLLKNAASGWFNNE